MHPLHYAQFFIAAALVSPVCAQQTTDWQTELEPDFSVRCSKPPRTVQLSTLTGQFVEQIYLQLSAGRLSRLRYSTSVDAPHHWYNSEAPVVYIDKKSGGKSKIDVQRQYRRLNGKNLTSITMTLDASAAQSGLDLLMTDFVTLGSWKLQRDETKVTLKESTSIIEDGKLGNASAEYWSACRLLSADGSEIMR